MIISEWVVIQRSWKRSSMCELIFEPIMFGPREPITFGPRVWLGQQIAAVDRMV